MLCSNRPEGFGPHSHLSSPVPTTCFVDVVIIPIPVWIALLLLPAMFLLSTRHRNPSTARMRFPRSCLYTTTLTIYYLLIVCNILMETLEIVRLSLIHFGIGLLPFTYVGLLMGAALHLSKGISGRISAWQAINGVLWLGGMVVSVVKVAGLVMEGINGRKGSKYPVSDQVIDVAVIAGVYAVVLILEIILGMWDARRARSGHSMGSSSHQQRAWRRKHTN